MILKMNINMTDITEKTENGELVTNRDQLVVMDNIESLIKVIRGQQRYEREFDQLRNEMMNTIILNKYQMRELSFKMVIRAYLICALMTSILGIISCSVHDIINWFPIVLLYAWIILSPISILALITVYLLGVQRDWICKIPLICLCAFIVYFINLNSSESYLINFFATQTVPYDLLYYNNGIEIRVNDTIFSIFTWVLSYFILVLLIVISTIMYRFFKKHSKIKLF